MQRDICTMFVFKLILGIEIPQKLNEVRKMKMGCDARNKWS